MAGSYPDAPSRRMAWDEDGTFVAISDYTTGPLREYNQTMKSNGNKEDNSLVGSGWQTASLPTHSTYWIFPELREFDGYFIACNGSNGTSPNLYRSGDTTNGHDGTWVTQATGLPRNGGPYPTVYRTAVVSAAESNIRSLRVTMGVWNASNYPTDFYAFHWYGEITPGQTPDRLLFIDSGTNLEFGLPIDYGDVPRGSASDRTIKLRNNSATLTASTVQMTGEALYLNSGAWYTFSDGAGFQSTLPLASAIGPASDSPVITVRRDIPDGETVGLHAGRVQVSVGSWS